MKFFRLKKLIQRYQQGKASPAERYIVERWLESFQHDEQRPWGTAEKLQNFKQHVLDRAFAGRTVRPRPNLRGIKWAAAAVVLATVVISLLLFRTDNAPYVLATGIKQIKHLTLPDSTSVYLNANSRLTVDFGKRERVVILEGEAFFEVTPDQSKPFKVHTRGLDIGVLGTAFHVNAYPSVDDIRVTVRSGSVQVADSGRVLAVLKAADGLTYNRHTDEFYRTEISAGEEPSWWTGVTVLTDASFAMLAQSLYNQYGIVLESTDDDVRAATYNVTVRASRTLEQTLSQLCAMVQKKYRKEGNRVVIY